MGANNDPRRQTAAGRDRAADQEEDRAACRRRLRAQHYKKFEREEAPRQDKPATERAKSGPVSALFGIFARKAA